MSTPLTAPKPDMPTGSSNPVSWKSWFTKIGDWIAGMSPSGATVYDTGWVNVTPASGFTASRAQVRRIGNEVIFRGVLTGPLTTTITSIGTVPAGFWPLDSADASGATAHGNGTTGWGQVNAAGDVRARLASGSATTGTFLRALSGYTVN